MARKNTEDRIILTSNRSDKLSAYLSKLRVSKLSAHFLFIEFNSICASP